MDPLKVQPSQDPKLHFLDYWRIIRIRKTVILAVFLLVVITATLVTFILPESFSSTARIKVERDVTDIPSISDRPMFGGYDVYFIQTEFEVIQSEVILNKVIEELNLNEEWGKKYAGGDKLKTSETMGLLKSRMDLHPVRNTSIIEIRVFSENKDEAARLANKIATVYHDHRINQRKELSEGGISKLEERFKEQETRVENLQKEADKMRQDLDISDTGGNSANPSQATPLEIETLRSTEEKRVESTTKFVGMQTLLERMKAVPPDDLKKVLPRALQDPILQGLLTDLNQAEQRFVIVSNDYSREHPEFQKAEGLLIKINHQIDEAVKGIMITLESQVAIAQGQLNMLSNEVWTAKENDRKKAEKSRPYFEKMRELEGLLRFRQILDMKIASEKLDLTLPKTTMVEIVDNATPGTRPVRPNKPLNIILGIVIGLVVGVGLAFFIEYLDTSVKTIDDVERTLGAPVLGVIPQNVGVLLDEGAESPHAEAYRVLRTNLLFSRKDERLSAVCVVSAGAGEGKSTTVLNLACIFAQNGSRVLVVDSDLRRPTLHKMLKCTNSIGLTNYLLKQNRLEEVVQTTSLPSLDFLASGKLPSSSLGILSSQQMRQLISELKQRYDYVFFDSPPIMGVSDASILASEVDIALQVIQYRRYPQPMNIRAKQMIEKVGGNLVGIVLNNINMSQDESYYYYSGYYHDYYSKNEEMSDAATDKDGKSGGDKSKPDIKQKY